MPDFDRCYRIVASRDQRFDGWFITAVRTTGIYCRPSCPATTPKSKNVTFFPTAAAAQIGGYRACKRCRPDATPGSPEWNHRSDLVARAVRLIGDGVVDRDGVAGLASRLGYSERHLNRLVVAELGAPPVALARSQRAQNARLLIETSSMAMVDVAFASGFGSLRQFNDTIRDVFAANPTELRRSSARRTRDLPAGNGRTDAGAGVGLTLRLRLARREPFCADHLWGFLARRTITGVECGASPGRYRRALDLAHGHGVVELSPGSGCVDATLRLADVRDLSSAVSRCRLLLDLDADPVAIDGALAADPVLGALVAARPGLRCAGAVDGYEIAVRAILGQQMSLAASVARLSALATRFGEPLSVAVEGTDRLFPRPAAIAAADPSTLGVPAVRAKALVELSRRCAAAELVLDPGADRAETRAVMSRVVGVGSWTADYVAMRALGDPDVLMSGDLVVRREWCRRGGDGADMTGHSVGWSPWRSTVTHHLWAAAVDRTGTSAAPVRSLKGAGR